MANLHEHYDVIIVGAGLSGIGMACQLKQTCPEKTFAILEARAGIGGTWDLFKYPGIRSDSDFYTFSYAFNPWKGEKSIADGPSILQYIRQTAQEYDVEKSIHFNNKVTKVVWSSSNEQWSIECLEVDSGQTRTVTCSVLSMCAGYYDYDKGYLPEFKDIELFQGKLIHPQFWPEGYDYSGKQVVIIGSGATAVTLAPAMSDTAAKVTVLQRSPTYVASLPSRDKIALWLQRFLPDLAAHRVARTLNIARMMLIYNLSMWRPQWMKKLLLWAVSKEVGAHIDMKHFTPSYNPWEERLCVVPDGDLFKAVRQNKVQYVTDHIDRFVAEGIVLSSGETLPADVVVTATGLSLKILGGIQVVVDDQVVDMSQKVAYKAMMLNGIPNMVMTLGYTNASWTLKADLVANFTCRLIQHLEQSGQRWFVPVLPPGVQREPLLNLRSGYVQRVKSILPAQGHQYPWKVYQNYVLDWLMFRHGRLADGVLRFGKGFSEWVTAR